MAQNNVCKPTRTDWLGPYYEPEAPIRSRVGSGYTLHGKIRSAKDCVVLPGARLEFWLAGPGGDYDAEHRGTLFSDAEGSYRLETNFPSAYSSRPPHIHLKVTAEGHEALVTQHYPKVGNKERKFDLVLVPNQ